MKKLEKIGIAITCSLSTVAAMGLTTGVIAQYVSTLRVKTSINKSNRFEYEKEKIGWNIAEPGFDFAVKVKPKAGFRIAKEDITVTIDGENFTNFEYEVFYSELQIEEPEDPEEEVERYIVIPGQYIKEETYSIDINVDAAYQSEFIIEDNVVKGFNKNMENYNEELEKTLRTGYLYVPASVEKIADYAFYNKDTQESLIPSSVKKLVFEQRYSHLSGTQVKGEEPGIGKYAFANAPLEEITFPVGKGYDIDEGAFEGCKLYDFAMPMPEFWFQDGVQLGMWTHFEEEIAIEGTVNYFNNRGIQYINEKAFHNCTNLRSIKVAPFFKGTQNAVNVFTFDDKKESNIRFIDLSAFLPYATCDEGQTRADILAKSIKVFTKLHNEVWQSIGGFGGFVDWIKDIPQYKDVSTQHKITDVPYIAFLDTWNLLNNQREQIIYCNIIHDKLGREPITDPTKCFTSSLNFGLIPSTQNVYKSKAWYNLDTFALTNPTATIDLSKTPEENKQSFIVRKVDSTNGSTQEFANKSNDLIYEIEEANWTTGTPVNLTIEQVEDQTEGYMNNFFKIMWENNNPPKAGDVVELKITITSKFTQRSQTQIPLTISFA